MAMMAKREMIGLPVETVSGISLGKLTDLEIDENSQMVKAYQVQTSRLLPGFLSDNLLVGRDQVVSVSNKKIVVDDSMVKEKESVFRKASLPEAEASPLATLER